MAETTNENSEVKEQEVVQTESVTTEETLKADEADEIVEPQTVPVAKHVALRQRAQTAEMALARTEGALAALQQQTINQPAATKSPLDLEVERQAADGIAEEDMTVSPRIVRAQQLHDQQIANQQVNAQAKSQLAVTQTASMNQAVAGHDDWHDVIKKGEHLLTKGEVVDVTNAGKDFGELFYAKCAAALAVANPVTKTETVPEKKPSEPETKPVEKVPTQTEILKDSGVDPMVEAAAHL